MYRQIFAPTASNLKEDKILENRKKREENSKKYSVSFSSIGYKFNRETAQ